MKSYDDVLDDSREFLREVQKLSCPSSREAVMEYLLRCLEHGESGAADKCDKAALISYARNGLDEGSAKAKEDWQSLSDYMEVMFADNGFLLEEQNCDDWEEYFRDLVLDLSYAGLRDLALGTGMSTEELDRFLKQVLHRSGINFYRVEEVFLYLVLCYAKEAGEMAGFTAMRKLKKLYPFGRWKDRKTVSGVHMDGYQTRSVRTRDVRYLLIDLLEDDRCSASLFTERNAELDCFIRWIRRLEMEDHVRSCEEVFFEQVKKLKLTLQETEQFQEYMLDEELFREGEKVNRRFEKKAQVHFKTSFGVEIPSETILFCPLRKGELHTEARFKVKQAVKQEPDRKMCMQIPVEPLTDPEVLGHYKEAAKLKTLPKFVKNKYMNEEFLWEESHMWQVGWNIHLPEKGGAIPFVRTEEGKTGILELEVAAGAVIPKGTKLYFNPAHAPQFRFVYRVAEEVKAEASCTVELHWVNHDVLWEKWPLKIEPRDVDVAPTGTILLAEDIKLRQRLEEEGVSICLDKPLKMYNPTDSEIIKMEWVNGRIAGRRGGVRGRSRSKDDSQISNLSMLRYIYQGAPDENSYYEGFLGWGEDFFLNSPAFLETRLKNDILDKFVRTDGMRRRYLIETLVWLVFVLDPENVENFLPESDEEEAKYISDLQSDFEIQVEEVMSRCGLQGFSASDPYDAYLQLLLTYDEPFSLFRGVWSQEVKSQCKPVAAGKRSKIR